MPQSVRQGDISLSFSSQSVSDDDVSRFQQLVFGYYEEHAREFPWRETTDPFSILVSEVMLQQTQTYRVVEKYKEFLVTFPTVLKLGSASFADVAKVWQGLGYNRRAKMLHESAKSIVSEHGGKVPNTLEELITLPGIGHNTAAAILAYAFNLPVVYIETNIRTIYLHHFFRGELNIKDSQLLPLIDQTLDRENPRQWYSALMDYGVFLKVLHPEVAQQSAQYKKQAPFKGSNREVRGGVLKLLVDGKQRTLGELEEDTEFTQKRLETALKGLVKEGMVELEGGYFSLI